MSPGRADDGGRVSDVSEEEATPETVQDSEKLFKQLGFPQVETSKFNPGDYAKIAKCIGKRTSKMSEMVQKINGVETKTDQQKVFLGHASLQIEI